MKREGLTTVKDLDLEKDFFLPDEIVNFAREDDGEVESVLMVVRTEDWFERIGLTGYQKGFVLIWADNCHCCSDEELTTRMFKTSYFTHGQFVGYMQREVMLSKNCFRKQFFIDTLQNLGADIHLF